MNIDNELIRAMQDCDTTKARVSNLYKKSEDLRGFRSWDLHTRDPSVKAAAESIAATKREIAAKEKGTGCIRGIGDRYPLWFPYVRSNISETTLRRSLHYGYSAMQGASARNSGLPRPCTQALRLPCPVLLLLLRRFLLF